MNPKLVHPLKSLSLAVLAFLTFQSCDSLKEEGLPDPDSPEITINLEDLYVYANSTGVLDLSKGVTANVPVVVSIGKQPEQGDLDLINPGIYTYTPAQEFTKGIDRISVRVSTPSGTFTTMDTVEVHVAEESSELPCNYYALNEEVVLQTLGESLTIDVFTNDVVCSPWAADKSTLTIMYSTSNGSSRVENGKIVYTHNPEKPMLDNIFYTFNLENCPECIRGAYIRFTGSTVNNCTGTELRPDHMTISTIGPVTFENEFTFTRLKPMHNDIFCGDDAAAEKVLRIVDGPDKGHAEVDGTTGSIKYWIALNTVIDYRDTITYEVCIAGNCMTQKHALSVRYDPTCGILATDDNMTVSLPIEPSVYTLDVLANDELCSLSEDVSITLKDLPVNGEAWVENKKIYYRNSDNQFTANIKYTICTSGGYCSPRTAYVTVTR